MAVKTRFPERWRERFVRVEAVALLVMASEELRCRTLGFSTPVAVAEDAVEEEAEGGPTASSACGCTREIVFEVKDLCRVAAPLGAPLVSWRDGTDGGELSVRKDRSVGLGEPRRP